MKLMTQARATNTPFSFALGSNKIRLRSLQSLLGKLNFACRIMPMGRIFCRHLASATSGVKAPHHFVRLSKAHKDDLRVWQLFLAQFNGRSLWMDEMGSACDLELYTDVAGAVGYGATLGSQWSAGKWPDSWRKADLLGNLVLLELFPIVMAVEIWQQEFKNKRVLFHCDNLGVVQAINKISASSPPVVRFLRHLVLLCLCLNCYVRAVHVPGVTNNVADALSRLQWARFRMLAPGAGQHGRPCPDHLWDITFER